MTEDSQNLAKGINLELYEAEKVPNRINSKKSTWKQTLNFRKLKTKISENNEEEISYLHGKNNLNYSVFHTPLQKAWRLEGSSRIFSSAEGKELSA